MFTSTQNPVLEFIAVAAAIAAGFAFVYDTRSPVAKASFLSRVAAMLAVAFFVASMLDRVLVWFSPVFNGANSSTAVLEFVGGLLLLGGLIGAVLVLRGDLKVNFSPGERRPVIPPGQSYFTPAVAPEATSSTVCAQCGSALKPDAIFCTNCGARTQAIA